MIRSANLSLFGFHKCRYCGAAAVTKSVDGICAECAFWLDIINKSPEEIEVVGDTCYRILPFVDNPPAGAILGSDGKTFYFMANDHTVKKSNDVWVVGKVPSRFAIKLAPTGCFITRGIYNRIMEGLFSCEAIGCYDRYHCLQYNYKLEYEMNAPFNKVPLDWVVGGEKCPSFINIAKIHGYVPYDISDIL